MYFIVNESVLSLIVQEITGEKKENSPNTLTIHLHLCTTENRMRGFVHLTTFSVDIEHLPHFKGYPFKKFRIAGSFWNRVFSLAMRHASIEDIDRTTFLAALPRGTLHIEENGEVFFEARNLSGFMEQKKSITRIRLEDPESTPQPKETPAVIQLQVESPPQEEIPHETESSWRPIPFDEEISIWDDSPNDTSTVVKLELPGNIPEVPRPPVELTNTEIGELDTDWLDKPRYTVVDDKSDEFSIKTERIEVPIFQRKNPLTGWA
jgi:hypothetical protein